MSRFAAMAFVGILSLSVVALAPPASATHAYQCGAIVDDPLVTQLECGIHCSWDAFTGAQPKYIPRCFGLLD